MATLFVTVNPDVEHMRVKRTEHNFIRTYTGRKFWPLDPRADEIFIEDVAHHLSLECRFTGATYCHYSVAEHSLHVSKLAERMALNATKKRTPEILTWVREMALWGLLHDASEAYLKDFPRPIKHAPGLGELYRKIEAMIMGEVVARFDLIPQEPAIVKQADLILCATEKRDLMTNSTRRRGEKAMPETIYPMDEQKAEVEFLRRFEALTMARKADRLAAALDTETYIATALCEASRKPAGRD